MMAERLCRLCLTTQDLVWIFDNRITEPGNMKEVITITTGVEIKDSDRISQNVCKKCCQITIKMYKFRATAVKNDKELRNRLLEIEQAEKRQLSKHHQAVNTNIEVDETSTSFQANSSSVHSKVQKPSSNKLSASSVQRAESPPCSNNPQDTVTSLLHTYPQLKIPRSCLKWNFLPAVTINKDDVSAWFTKKRKRDEARATQNNLSPKLLVKTVQNGNIATRHNSGRVSQEGVSKLVKRKLTCSEVLPAKRKLSSETSQPRRKVSSDTRSSCSSDLDKDEALGPSGVAEKEQSDVAELRLLSHVNKSTNVNVCTVCNAVTYSNKAMRVHSRKHTVCPFCKVRFKTMEAKNNHVDRDCPIKSIMQNLPTIPLVRAEQVRDLIKQYPYAFEPEVISSDEEERDNQEILIMDDSDDPLAIDNINRVTNISTRQELISSPVHSLNNKTGGTESTIGSGQNNPIEQIDITLDDDIMYISDDEIQLESPNDQNKRAPDAEVNESTDNTTESKSTTESLGDNAKNADNVITTPNNTIQAESAKSKKVPAKVPVFNITNDPYIKSVDAATSELELIKTLFSETDKCPGLLPPTNKSIVLQGASDKIFALTNIVYYLRKYKIPIDMSFNSKLTVSYEPFKPCAQSKVDLWSPKMARTQRSMIPEATTSTSSSTLPTTSAHTSSATCKQTSSVASNQTSLGRTSTSNQPHSTTHKQALTTTNNQTSPTTNNQALPTTNNQPLVSANSHTLSTTNSEPLPTINNQTLLATNQESLTSTISQMFANSSTCVSTNIVSTAASTQTPVQHPAQEGTYAIGRETTKNMSQSKRSNNSTLTLNSLLNQALDRPIANNGVYNAPSFRMIDRSEIVTTPNDCLSFAPTGVYGIDRPRSSAVAQGIHPAPNHFRSPSTYLPRILRPPPPNYWSVTPHRFTSRPPAVRASGLRVKTAEELNKKF